MPSGSGCGLPACLPLWREGPIRQPACFPLMLVNLFFCELTRRHSEAVRSFQRKTFSFFFGLPGECADRVPILHSLPQIVLKAFRSSPHPMHPACASLFSSCSLLANAGDWATSHKLWVLFFFPPGYVALQDSKTPHRLAGERVCWC